MHAHVGQHFVPKQKQKQKQKSSELHWTRGLQVTPHFACCIHTFGVAGTSSTQQHGHPPN